jgi:hypothetical protein
MLDSGVRDALPTTRNSSKASAITEECAADGLGRMQWPALLLLALLEGAWLAAVVYVLYRLV